MRIREAVGLKMTYQHMIKNIFTLKSWRKKFKKTIAYYHAKFKDIK